MLINYSTAILDIYQSIHGLRNQLVCSHTLVFIRCVTESFPIKDFRLLVLGGCKRLITIRSRGLISQSRFMPIWSPYSRIWVTSNGRSSKSTSPLIQLIHLITLASHSFELFVHCAGHRETTDKVQEQRSPVSLVPPAKVRADWQSTSSSNV